MSPEATFLHNATSYGRKPQGGLYRSQVYPSAFLRRNENSFTGPAACGLFQIRATRLTTPGPVVE
jgi:hypothetical protein